MGQNQSKYFNELRRSQRLKESCMKIVTTPQVLTVKSVEKHSKCVSIAFEEEGALPERYATKAHLEEMFIKGMVVFSVPSLKLAWYYGYQCSAKAAQVDAGLEGICVLAFPLTGNGYALSHILYMPWINASAATFLCPLLDHISKADLGVPSGFSAVELAPIVPELNDVRVSNLVASPLSNVMRLDVGSQQFADAAATSEFSDTGGCLDSECICCMEFKASYRWAECFHSSDGPALLCLRCRNVLLTEAMLRQGCRDKYRLRIPCFICKKYSNMVRWRTGG